jgi:hypothetical protein
MASKSKRLLVIESTLKESHRLSKLGVPIAAIIRSLGVDISHQTFSKLVFYYGNSLVPNSVIFPEWLDSDGHIMQVQPEDWVFNGRFPLGEWEKRP